MPTLHISIEFTHLLSLLLVLYLNMFDEDVNTVFVEYFIHKHGRLYCHPSVLHRRDALF